MGRALPNFRELADIEAQEPKLVEMVQRFDTERSDLILQNTQDALAFVRLVGDVANLYFPAMFDTLFGISHQSDEETPSTDSNHKPTPPATEEEGPNAPNLATGKPKKKPGDGPTQV